MSTTSGTDEFTDRAHEFINSWTQRLKLSRRGTRRSSAELDAETAWKYTRGTDSAVERNWSFADRYCFKLILRCRMTLYLVLCVARHSNRASETILSTWRYPKTTILLFMRYEMQYMRWDVGVLHRRIMDPTSPKPLLKHLNTLITPFQCIRTFYTHPQGLLRSRHWQSW